MSLIAAKFFPEKGWVLVKNRDRILKPTVKLRKSFRKNVERLYCWDDFTKYSEGINEFGVAIVSCNIARDEDDTEGAKAASDESTQRKPRRYYSPDGLRIRTALFEKTVYDAARKLVELEIPGSTIIADRKTCFILEGAFTKDEDGIEEYVYVIKEVPTTHVVVRTNHGILLPWAGYSLDNPEEKKLRLQSEARYKKALALVKGSQNADALLDAISDRSEKDPQLNPLRLDDKKGAIRSTGQIVVCPKDMTLFYRPIWCETLFDLESLNNKEEKTYFEIISSRKLLKLKDVLEMRTFSKYLRLDNDD